MSEVDGSVDAASIAAPLNTAVAAPVGKAPAHVQVAWAGDHRFDGKRQGDFPSIRIDASGKTGPSPVDTLLLAMASCTGVDVVDILEKRRTPVATLDMDVTGERFNGVPARITRIVMTYRMTGEAVERAHAERAIELAITKYCSVRDSLRQDIPVEWRLVLNGE
jgi:putative redox protein